MTSQNESATDELQKLEKLKNQWYQYGRDVGQRDIIDKFVELLGIQRMIDKSIDDSKQFSDDDY